MLCGDSGRFATMAQKAAVSSVVVRGGVKIGREPARLARYNYCLRRAIDAVRFGENVFSSGLPPGREDRPEKARPGSWDLCLS